MNCLQIQHIFEKFLPTWVLGPTPLLDFKIFQIVHSFLQAWLFGVPTYIFGTLEHSVLKSDPSLNR